MGVDYHFLQFVIVKVFYLLLLIVSYKFSVHFHLIITKMPSTLGRIIFIHLLRVTVIYSLCAIYKFTSVLPLLSTLYVDHQVLLVSLFVYYIISMFCLISQKLNSNYYRFCSVFHNYLCII